MTAVTPPPATTRTASAAGQLGAALRGGVNNALSTTPSRLRLAQLGTAGLAVLFALLAALGMSKRIGDVGQAAKAGQRLIQVQNIRVAIVKADSVASASYLKGGQEDPDQRSEYLAKISEATQALVAASDQVNDVDRKRLADVSTALGAYQGLIEQARANNRQGFPVGVAYLDQAHGLLNDPEVAKAVVPDMTNAVVPMLREIEASIRAAVNHRINNAADDGAWVVVPGIATLLAIVVGSVWLARRFRRQFNPMVLAAGALVLVAVLVGDGVLRRSFDEAQNAVSGPLQRADTMAQARAALYDARSQEALTLVHRGNGAEFESGWKASEDIAFAATQNVCLASTDGCQVNSTLREYVAQHEALRKMDDGGGWEQAVSVFGDPQSALSQSFLTAAESSDAGVKSQAVAAGQAFDESRSGLGTYRLLLLLSGFAAAVLVIVGYGRRLAEYR